MNSLSDKIAIVTGGSAGIGRAIAERLAQEGAAVVVNYGKSADKAKGPYFALQEAAKAIEDGGRIVNISTGGTHLGILGATAYLGTKAAW